MTFLRNTKKGSYILEASIALPIFIVGILLISSIIGIIAKCENINYILCDEIEKMQYEAMINPAPRNRIENRIGKETKIKEILATSTYSIITGKITVKAYATINPKAVIDVSGRVNFEESISARAFVGATRTLSPLTKSTFETPRKYEGVFICPNSGKRYHKRSCTYVNSYPVRSKLTNSIKKKYKACKVCDSSNATMGQMIYYFEYGSSYHVRNCPTINKYVIEMDKSDAQKRGYTPCLKCGG